MSNKYRPSNGTEGDYFTAQWCKKCEKHYQHEEYGLSCRLQIYENSMIFDVDEDGYPGEWIVGEDGLEKCTAYVGPGSDRKPTPTALKNYWLTPQSYDGQKSKIVLEDKESGNVETIGMFK